MKINLEHPTYVMGRMFQIDFQIFLVDMMIKHDMKSELKEDWMNKRKSEEKRMNDEEG